MKVSVINGVIGVIFGFVASRANLGFDTWQYWALLACLIGAIINNLINSKGE